MSSLKILGRLWRNQTTAEQAGAHEKELNIMAAKGLLESYKQGFVL